MLSRPTGSAPERWSVALANPSRTSHHHCALTTAWRCTWSQGSPAVPRARPRGGVKERPHIGIGMSPSSGTMTGRIGAKPWVSAGRSLTGAARTYWPASRSPCFECQPAFRLRHGVCSHRFNRRAESGHSKSVSYTHLRAHETDSYLVCRLLLEKKKQPNQFNK